MGHVYSVLILLFLFFVLIYFVLKYFKFIYLTLGGGSSVVHHIPILICCSSLELSMFILFD